MNDLRHPALRAAMLLAGGIAFGMWMEGRSSMDGMIPRMTIIVAATFALLFVQLASAWRRVGRDGGAALHLATIALTGWSLSTLAHADGRLRQEAFGWTDRVHGEEMELVGRLMEIRPARTGWTIRVETAAWGPPASHERWPLETQGRFQLTAAEPQGEGLEGAGMEGKGKQRGGRLGTPGSLPRPGDVLHVRVRLQSAESNRNPGGFDYGAWLAREGMMLTGTVVDWKVADGGPGWVEGARNQLMDRIRRQYSDETAPFVMAFVLGYRSELDREVKEAFSRAGLSHIMAVSGLHVGFVIGPIWALLPWIAARNSGRALGFILLIGVLAGYSALTGFSVSVNRASIMAGLVAARRLFHLPGDSVNILATAAFLLLLIRPLDLAAPGFQLSFGAVALLMVWLPPLQEWIREHVRWAPAASLLSMLAVTAGIQTGLAPMLGSWFGEVSWIAPASNLLVVPILSILMPLTIAILLAGGRVSEGDGLMMPAEAAFRWILKVSEWTGSTDAHVLATGEVPAWFSVLWMGFLLMVRPGMGVAGRWRMMRYNLAVLTAAGIIVAAERARPPILEVVVLDVGQGDAIAIHTPGGGTYLVDAGWKERGWDSGGKTILPYLASRGIERIDGLFLTHPHADHIGGAVSLAESLEVVEVLRSRSAYRTGLTAALDSVIAARRIPTRTVQRGDILDLGSGVSAFVLHPGLEGGSSSEVNDGSLTLQIRYGTTRFLLTGDAQRRSEQEMAAWFGEELRSDVLKAGHHGSRTSSTEPFLQAVDPRMVVVSVAFRNRYRLPNRDAVERMRFHASEVAFTSLDGPVRMFSDSEKIRMLKVR